MRKLYRRYLLSQYHRRRKSIRFHHDAMKSVWDQEIDWRIEHSVPLAYYEVPQ